VGCILGRRVGCTLGWGFGFYMGWGGWFGVGLAGWVVGWCVLVGFVGWGGGLGGLGVGSYEQIREHAGRNAVTLRQIS
jgi:hypothetical protein